MSRAVRAGGAFLELGVRPALEKGLNAAERRLRSFGKGAAVLGGSMVGTVATAITPLLTAAASAEEVRSKFDAVFGDASESTRAWASEFAGAVGRSQIAIEGFLSGSQDLLVPMGLEPGAAQTMSKQLTELTVDLASFNNRAESDVMLDLQAALTGSGEVMKKYGVIVSQAAVNQQLLNSGMDPANATEAQKAQARFAIIMEGTTAAQGDAIRTSGSFTNQLRRLRATVGGLAVMLGDHLIPPATAVVRVIGDAITTVVDFARENELLTKIVLGGVLAFGAIGGVIATVGAAAIAGSVLVSLLGTALGVVGSVLGFMLGPGLAIAAVIAVIGAAIYAAREPILAFGRALWDTLQPAREAFGQLWEIVKTTFAAMKAAFEDGGITAAASTLWLGLQALFFRGAQSVADLFSWLFGEATGWLGGIGDALVSGDLSLAADILWAQLSVVWITAQNAVRAAWIGFTLSLSDTLRAAMAAIAETMSAGIGGMLTAIDVALGQVSAIAGVMQTVLSGVAEGMQTGLRTVLSVLDSAMMRIDQVLERMEAFDPTGAVGRMRGLVDGARDGIAAAQDMSDGVIGGAMDAVTAQIDSTIDGARAGIRGARAAATAGLGAAADGLEQQRVAARERANSQIEAMDQRLADARQRRDQLADQAAEQRGDDTFGAQADRRLAQLRAQAEAAREELIPPEDVAQAQSQADATAQTSREVSARTEGSFSAVGAFLLGLGGGDTAADRTARATERTADAIERIEDKPAPEGYAFS